MTKKNIIALLISVLVFVVTFISYHAGLFDTPEHLVYDAKAKLYRAEKAPPKNVKVVLVDEASIKAMEGVAGRWPWPRAIWSDLLEFLSMGGARTVLFDILFTERQDEANDRVFAEATKASQNVVHSMLLKREKPDVEQKYNTELDRPIPVDYVSRFALRNVSGALTLKPAEKNNDWLLPIESLRTAAKGVAVVEFTPDSDGVLRRTKPLREYQGAYFPVLGLAPFITNDTRITIRHDSISLDGRTLPIDADGNYIINMYGIDKIEPISVGGIFASLQKIRKGEVEDLVVSPEEFKDCIVFVGVSAIGGYDLKATPLATQTPGVVMHVSLAGNYLMNDFLKPTDTRVTFLSIIAGAFLSTWVVFFSKRFSVRAIFPMSILILYIWYAFFAFKSNTLVDTVPFVFATVTSSFLSFGYLSFTEAAEKRRVSHLFTQYVSKDVLDEVLHHYKDYMKSSLGQKVELTVLFSDIRGFTTFSENTPPERIVEMLNTHFSRMAEIILRHNGTLDKYIGDAIMAFWGAPVPTSDHPERAVTAALEMLDALKDVNEVLKEKGFDLDLKIGIGINTGVATIGNIGSEQKLNYTVVGDTVNLASRLESLTKDYNSALIVSEYTYERIKNKIPCEPLGVVKVKGREKEVTIYRPLGKTGA